MRCRNCGYQNPEYRETCLLCNEVLRRAEEVLPRNRPNRVAENRTRRKFLSSPNNYTQESYLPSNRPFPRSSEIQKIPDLEGTIIHIDPHLIYEQEDFNPIRFINKLLIFLIIVSLPLIVLRILLAALGPLSAILCLIGVLFLSRFLFPTNLLAYIGIFSLLNPFRRDNRGRDVPVRILRIRDPREREHLVRVKGNITHGGFMEGDEVYLWGSWRRGTFYFKKGINMQTGSEIILQKDYAWVGLIITLSILGMIVLFFYAPVRTIMETLSKLGG